MQLKAFLTFGLIGSAVATAIPRDLPTITGALGKVSDALMGLDTAIDSFSGDAAGLNKAADDLQAAITSGTTAVTATSAVTQTEALDIQTAVQDIIKMEEHVTEALAEKKAALTSANVAATVLSRLQQQKTDSAALSKAVSSKVPAELQSVAEQLSAQVAAPIDEAIAAFS